MKGIHTHIHKMRKETKWVLIALLIGLACAVYLNSVSAFGVRTIYNPFTGKLDYVRDSNYSTENLTINNLYPSLNNTYNIGSSLLYWANLYINRIYLLTQLVDSQISDDITTNATKLIEKTSLQNSHTLDVNNITNNIYNYNMTYSGSTYNATYADYSYNQTVPANTYTDTKVGTANLHLHDATNITNEIWVNASGDTMTGNLNISGGSNITQISWIKLINTLIGNGDNIRIGDAGSDSHSLTANDDLFVSGKLEVDGVTYIDSFSFFYNNMQIQDEKELQVGTGASDALIQWDTTQTPNTFLLGVGADSNGMLICERGDEDYDFAHPLQSNPTLWLHSATQSTTQWGSLSHDTKKFQIDAGGVPNRMANNTEVTSKLDVNMDLTAGADLIVGDELADIDLFTIESNGTAIVMTPYTNLSVYIKTYSPNGTLFTCGVNNTGSWVCN